MKKWRVSIAGSTAVKRVNSVQLFINLNIPMASFCWKHVLELFLRREDN